MQHDYAQALISHLENGVSADEALAGLVAVLTRRHHQKLLPLILRVALRTLEADTAKRSAVVRVASPKVTKENEATIKAALSALGVTAATPVDEVIDETLIGGFIARYNFTEQDHSYKRVLTNLYESITA